MADVQLPQDFKEFSRLFNVHGVEHLVLGGYAVSCHGYPRATADLDVWVAGTPENAAEIVAAIREFGFDVSGLDGRIFLKENNVVRMGVPPMRTDLEHLKVNKRAAGRHKDLVPLSVNTVTHRDGRCTATARRATESYPQRLRRRSATQRARMQRTVECHRICGTGYLDDLENLP